MILDEKKLFYDLYEDGTMEYYNMTFGELVDTFGIKNAVKVWQCGYVPEDVYPLHPGQIESLDIDSIPENISLDEFISSYLFDD